MDDLWNVGVAMRYDGLNDNVNCRIQQSFNSRFRHNWCTGEKRQTSIALCHSMHLPSLYRLDFTKWV
jgi:hypothetical protein